MASPPRHSSSPTGNGYDSIVSTATPATTTTSSSSSSSEIDSRPACCCCSNGENTLNYQVNNVTSCVHNDNQCRRKPQRFVDHCPSQPLIPKKEEEDKIELWPFILINISLAFINCSSRFHGPVMDQYVYQEAARKILGRDDVITTSHPCLPDNVTSHLNKTLASLVLRAQDLASSTLLHLDLTSYGVGVFSNAMLGAYSSLLDRRVLLFIPTFGYLMRNIAIPVVIFWKLNLNWLFLGYAVDGLCGNASGIYFGSYLYTTDITSRSRKRTLGVAILHSLKGIVTASLNIATGHLIEQTGVFVPSVISAGCVLGSMITILFLPNRKPRVSRDQGSSGWSLSAAFKTYLIPFQSYKDRDKSAILILGYLSFLGVLVCHFGITKIRNLFLMNLPLCWSSSEIGWFLFGREMSMRIFVLVAVPCCHKRLAGVVLAVFGMVSYIGGQTVYALAQDSFQVMFAPLAAIGQSLPTVMIRGELSRLFEPQVQGPLFAGFAVMESVSFATGSLFLQIYSVSLSFFPRLVFAVSGGISILVLGCLIYLQVLWKRARSTDCVISKSEDDGTTSSATNNVDAVNGSINAS